jgi:GST-like protein
VFSIAKTKARAKARPAKSKAAAKKSAKKPSTKKVAKAAKGKGAAKARPIELHFWPTPNGVKISIMLEECKLPYTIVPVNIGKGDQFKPEFLKISPNNRMPAIVDPDGPGGKPIAIFESGAILQYLARKTGKFYGANERERSAIEQWVYWQVGNLGPSAGQLNHFRNYSDTKVDYAIERFHNENHRLYGVINRALSDGRQFLAGKYSIADMATWPWARGYDRRGLTIDEFPLVKAWLDRVAARPMVQKGAKVGEELRSASYNLANDAEAKKILFGQRATA